MKPKTVMTAAGFVLVGSMLPGCTTLRGLFNIQTSNTKAGETGEGETAAEPLTTTETLALEAGFANPLVLEDLRSEGVNSMAKHGVNTCQGYLPAEPSAVLELAEAANDVVVTAPGAQSLLVQLADGTFFCNTPTTTNTIPRVHAQGFPAGPLKIYAGSFHQGKRVEYSLFFDEKSRPLSLPWRDTAEPLTIGSKMPEPIVRTLAAKPSNQPMPRCGDLSFIYGRTTPDLVFRVERPLEDMYIDTRSSNAATIGIYGPIPEDGRDPELKCGRWKKSRMEPGLYAAYVAPDRSETETLHQIVFSHHETPLDPMTLPEAFDDDVPFEQRVVGWHFPLLGFNHLVDQTDSKRDNDAIRAWALENAPKSLFVFPTLDLDDATAQLYRHQQTDGWHGDSGEPVFPRANEPLLVVKQQDQGWVVVMATDGSLYRTQSKRLAAEPSGAVVLPEKARNPHMTFSRAVNGRAPEDKKVYRAYDKASRAFESCAAPIDRRADRKIQAIREKPRHQQSNARIDRIGADARADIERKCGGQKLDAKSGALWLALMDSRMKRRDAHLARVRTRLQGLFP